MKERKIFCSECIKHGRKPKLLGITEDAEGTIRLWCKSCGSEIRVTITAANIDTRPATQADGRQ